MKENISEQLELLRPKNDIVFHALFSEKNNKTTENFLSVLLQEKVKVEDYLDRHLDIKAATEKLGVMDLRVLLDNTILCDVEMQLLRHKNDIERFVYYLSNMYARQLESGEDYSNLRKTVCIVLVDYNLDILKDVQEIYSRWQFRDNKTGKYVLTNKIELIIIEMKKAKEQYFKNQDNELYQWLMFLDDPNGQEVKTIMDNNKEIKQAHDDLKEVSGDYETRRLAELHEKAIKDEKAALAFATESGYEKGVEETTIKTATNMLKLNVDIDIISKVSGLSKDEILTLKKSINCK